MAPSLDFISVDHNLNRTGNRMNTARRNQLLAFVVAILLGVIGFRGLLLPTSATVQPESSFTCVEFASAADAEIFQRTHVIPAGSSLSNKPRLECQGVQVLLQQ